MIKKKNIRLVWWLLGLFTLIFIVVTSLSA